MRNWVRRQLSDGPYAGQRSPRSPNVRRSQQLLDGELEVGPHGNMPRGDGLSSHHVPSRAYMERVHGVDPDDAIAIRVEHPLTGRGGRHRGTETYGRSPFVDESPRDALARDVQDLRRIYQREGLYGSKVRQALQDLIRANLEAFPHIFGG